MANTGYKNSGLKRIRGTPMLEIYTQFVQNTAITLYSSGLIQNLEIKVETTNLQQLIDLGAETRNGDGVLRTE
jgi:hypothetical protein